MNLERGILIYRLFIAVNLNDVIKSEIDELLTGVREKYRNVKWVKTDNLHITLKFLGDTPVEKVEAIEKVLANTVLNIKAFSIELGGLGVFPDLKRPRVIWIGVSEGRDSLIYIRDVIEEGLYKLNIPKESQSFKSHITLGRIKKFERNIKNILKEIKMDYSGRQEIKSLELMKSTLTPGGPVYEILGSYKLKNS